MPESRHLFGLLNLKKPPDVTSRGVVNQIQRLVRPVRCGHAGTLDPMATGVLLVCLGPATRLVPLLHAFSKTYVSTFQLGATSDTDDATGNVTPVLNSGGVPSLAEIRTALGQQTGTILQTPPAFSAAHVNGQRAYRLARAGHNPDLKPRPVVVHLIEVLRYEWPELVLRISCGSGTYIRSIARDLGMKLGCGGLMSALERTAIGPFRISEALCPDTLTTDSIPQALRSPQELVAHLPQYVCSDAEAADIRRGKRIVMPRAVTDQMGSQPTTSHSPIVALLTIDQSRLLALAEYRIEDGQVVLQPRTVFETTH